MDVTHSWLNQFFSWRKTPDKLPEIDKISRMKLVMDGQYDFWNSRAELLVSWRSCSMETHQQVCGLRSMTVSEPLRVKPVDNEHAIWCWVHSTGSSMQPLPSWEWNEHSANIFKRICRYWCDQPRMVLQLSNEDLTQILNDFLTHNKEIAHGL